MKGYWNMLWGVSDDRPIIEETLDSAPTAGINDDGGGWHRTDTDTRQDEPMTHQREVRRLHMIPENERDQWQEHTPGWYHKKGAHQ